MGLRTWLGLKAKSRNHAVELTVLEEQSFPPTKPKFGQYHGFEERPPLQNGAKSGESPLNRDPEKQNIQISSVASHKIFIRPNTPDLEVARSCLEGEFDSPIRAATPLIHGLIIDAGGYIGTSAIAFAEAFPDARVVTLEPSNANYEVLKLNVAGYKNIIPLNVALGKLSGRRILRNRRTGQWGFSLVENPKDCAIAAPLHDVEVITIEQIMSDFGADGIDILKLDIEGSEYELFESIPPWLNQTRIVVAELHDRIVPGCVAAFEKATAARTNNQIGEKIMSAI